MVRIGKLAYIIVDCVNNQAVAEFWSQLLGLRIARHNPPYIDLETTDNQPVLSFQKVPEKKAGKNRLHLDVKVTDLDIAKSQAEKLGAKLIEEHRQGKWRWLTMADPEGNEFCLVDN